MFKRILVLLLCLALCFAVGCGEAEETLSVDEGNKIEEEVKEEEKKVAVNPLTGIADLEPNKAEDRPVAIMVNNISIAQPVQTGLNKADVIYETEVEGGITRLLAVYQDISKVEQIGTVRSARYVYFDLALGHNAVYVHHGQDGYHVQPRFTSKNHFVVGTNSGGIRVSNGLASEHTLYAYGDKLVKAIKDNGISFENGNPSSWVKFADESEKVTLEGAGTSVKVPFSASYVTNFKYNEETGKYTRFFNNTERKDYITKETVEVKNIFVLKTQIATFSNCTDGYKHQDVKLQGGDGFYIVNGTSVPIKWSKGAAENGLKFTTADGAELTVNAGNSWVCLVKDSANITIA